MDPVWTVSRPELQHHIDEGSCWDCRVCSLFTRKLFKKLYSSPRSWPCYRLTHLHPLSQRLVDEESRKSQGKAMDHCRGPKQKENRHSKSIPQNPVQILRRNVRRRNHDWLSPNPIFNFLSREKNAMKPTPNSAAWLWDPFRCDLAYARFVTPCTTSR